MRGGINDIICDVSVESQGRRCRIAWTEAYTRAPVTVTARPVLALAADAREVASGALGSCDVSPAGDERMVFGLSAAGAEPLEVAERVLAFEGAVNFRDIGGYRAADGRRVRWGAIYRSGHMAHLTAADKDAFTRLGIGTVCDYRRAEERAIENTELPGEPHVETLGIPSGIGDPRFFHRLFEQTEDPAVITDALERMMVYLVREGAGYYRRLFEVLLDPPPGAVLMNCSGGKERTGVGAALLLTALGIPRETIMYDFLLTNDCFPAMREVPRVLEKYSVTLEGQRGVDLIMPLLVSPPSYLEVVFGAIDEDCGSGEAYLASRFDLGAAELARLRDLYLH